MFALRQLDRALRAGPRRSRISQAVRLLPAALRRPAVAALLRRAADAGSRRRRIFLKREDLNHTGAHKINNCIGQALLTRRMGKPRIIAETGAGQHGVATRHRRGPVRPAVPGLHGRGGRAPAEAQRLQDEGAGQRGRHASPAAAARCATPSTRPCATGWRPSSTRTTSSAASSGRTRFPRWSAISSRSSARRRGSSAWSRSAGCRTWSSPASAAAATRPACSIRSSAIRAVELVGVEAGGRGAGDGRARRDAQPRQARRAARHLQLRPAGRRRPDGRRPFGLGRPRLSRRRPGAQLLEGHRPGALHQRQRRRGAGGVSHLCSRLEGILPALETAHAVVEAMRHRGAAARTRTWWSSASPAAATRTASRWPGWKARKPSTHEPHRRSFPASAQREGARRSSPS